MLDELKEKLKDKFNILRVIMIAAMYIVVTVITAQFSFLDVQLRVTEALCILPVFTPVAVPALFIGCFFANLFAVRRLLSISWLCPSYSGSPMALERPFR